MNEVNSEIIEEIMQLKISNFIKNNRNMNKKELAIKIDKMLEKKESMYTMTKEQIEEILRNKK